MSQKENQSQWQVVSLKTRVDTSELGDLAKELGDLAAEGHLKIALDLKNNRFLSIKAISYISGLSESLASRGGECVLLACTEKTKRHFDIYGSLEHLRIVRSEASLTGGYERVTRSNQGPAQELP
jgi:anti-anti-sigma regulatory factor